MHGVGGAGRWWMRREQDSIVTIIVLGIQIAIIILLNSSGLMWPVFSLLDIPMASGPPLAYISPAPPTSSAVFLFFFGSHGLLKHIHSHHTITMCQMPPLAESCVPMVITHH